MLLSHAKYHRAIPNPPEPYQIPPCHTKSYLTIPNTTKRYQTDSLAQYPKYPQVPPAYTLSYTSNHTHLYPIPVWPTRYIYVYMY